MYKSEVYGKGGIYAKVVADSIANDVRITTLELRYPRFIHSEFLTHRMLSRNSSSSRAVPVERMIEQVTYDPAMPIHWGANKAGMQAEEELVDWSATWKIYAKNVAGFAKNMANAGYHKQIVNRLLEPFQFINTVVTATEWGNFFKLRLHPDAQPEIQELARVMKGAMRLSLPEEEGKGGDWPGLWHLPYISEEDIDDYFKHSLSFTDIKKASVARCARVSYLNHNKEEPNIEKDITLHDKLLEAGHMSPFEHIATPMKEEYDCKAGLWEKGITHSDKEYMFWSGNFRGWVQYRNLIGA